MAQPTPQTTLVPSVARAPHTNRLSKESSPYLRQHAHNPVDWYPWGDEAFAEARRRQVPIFLSIGYSTCYWCHVMERECFEDAAIAKLLNDTFVCIKADREERPDIDDIYMAAVQAMTGRGGWPMSVWLTPPSAEGASPESPGLEPFYAGTYFPNQPRQGMPSLQQVCANITEAWTNERDNVNAQAKRVADLIREQAAWERPVKIGPVQIGTALQGLLNIHDPTHGGFGRAPKFPQPVFLDLLMELEGRIPDPAVAGTVSSALRLTLDKMALGGMYDQLAGGFHRYSTDESWTVPHFEKMLYDNAMLTSVYARAYARGGGRDPFDAKVVRETIAWALREMRDTETGAFYSAQDAEVDGREGLNYLWTRPQLTQVLGEDDAVFAAHLLGFDTGTNFQDPHHPEDQRKNVLLMPQRLEAAAKENNTDPIAFGERWASVQSRLLEARTKRKQPRLDDKVITSWNGLMIGALADAAVSLGELPYLDEAEKTSKFFLVNMRTKTAGLFRTYRDTKAKTAGFLEDYAYLVQGLLKVHNASAASGRADTRYLKGAEELTKIALERFSAQPGPAQETSHPSGGGGGGMLFDTRADQPDLISRAATTHDGAMPSAQGVMLHNLIDLYLITRNQDYLDRAASLARALSGEINRSPLATVNSTRAALRLITLKKDTFDGLPEPTTAVLQETAVDTDTTPVQVHAETDRLTIPKLGEPPATLRLKITIDNGFHINANSPGVEGMTPLEVRIEGGLGVLATITYPNATKYEGHALPDGEGPLMVHSGEIELAVNLSRTDQPWQGRPILVLTYQACDDRACSKPQTISLDVALDPG